MGLFDWKEAVHNEEEKIKKDVENGLNRALGAVVNPIVECTDVDGVVRRIDVNHVMGESLVCAHCVLKKMT